MPRRIIRLLAGTLACLLAHTAIAEARGLELGISDGVFLSSDAGPWLDRAARSGTELVRLSPGWGHIAPTAPDDPASPSDPAYDWSDLDAAVAAAKVRGLEVLITLGTAPAWAEGAARPRSAVAGSWKPSPAAVGAFATAVARRYAGQAQYIQVWNEPNLDVYLAPQWVKRQGRYRPYAPARYRAMLNAAYPGVHAAGLKLVTAGTAPFGDPAPGGSRIAPLRFWRAVLSRRTRFDVIAHHPYGVSGPRRHALNRDDLSVPDVHKLVSLVRRARRAGRVLASAARHVWVTELSWDSRPPDPHGVPARRHARWLGDALYLLWRQGVETVVWFQVRDQAPEPSYAETNQSGLYLHDGTPKLARRAFAFPFACERHGTRVRVWTKAPHPGAVQIRRGATVVARLRAGASRVATARIRAHGTLHAVSGTASSLSCSV